MSDAEKLKWPAFRAAHKGTDLSEISNLWKQYKAGEYSLPDENELTTEEEFAAINKVAELVDEEHPDLLEEDEEVEEVEEVAHLERYRTLVRKLEKFGPSMSVQEVREIEALLRESAAATIPDNYHCTPTDSWKIWMGPTQSCLLINTSRKVAFTVSRGWWRTHYLNARYVDRELLPTERGSLMDGLRKEYDKKGRLIKRSPLPDVEIMLPRSNKEYNLRG